MKSLGTELAQLDSPYAYSGAFCGVLRPADMGSRGKVWTDSGQTLDAAVAS